MMPRWSHSAECISTVVVTHQIYPLYYTTCCSASCLPRTCADLSVSGVHCPLRQEKALRGTTVRFSRNLSNLVLDRTDILKLMHSQQITKRRNVALLCKIRFFKLKSPQNSAGTAQHLPTAGLLLIACHEVLAQPRIICDLRDSSVQQASTIGHNACTEHLLGITKSQFLEEPIKIHGGRGLRFVFVCLQIVQHKSPLVHHLT
mmetsp:Transcript_19809/g.50322  ORF Transcript_19809/g.50322 Transcript_19809/m.50322 type:complete len:203 (+) Transcript_19809:1255-1863(+)